MPNPIIGITIASIFNQPLGLYELPQGFKLLQMPQPGFEAF
jgi:hypothetical protein